MNYLDKPRNPTAAIGGIRNENMQAATTEVARKPSQMENAVSELSGQHARLEVLVGELERRISPILLPTPPSQPAGEASGEASQLSGKLFEEASICRRLAERIDSIISRVDL